MPSLAICDANVAVFWLIDDPLSEVALDARARHEMVAPRLLLSETANALRAYVRAGLLPFEIARSHLANLPRQIELRDEDRLMPSALRLAVEYDHPAYDCVYVSMAIDLAVPLITADAKLARKFLGSPGLELRTLQSWEP